MAAARAGLKVRDRVTGEVHLICVPVCMQARLTVVHGRGVRRGSCAGLPRGARPAGHVHRTRGRGRRAAACHRAQVLLLCMPGSRV